MSDGILVLNAGSSSIKFAIYTLDGTDPTLFIRGQVAGIGSSGWFSAKSASNEPLASQDVIARDHSQALGFLLDWLRDRMANLRIVGAGHRVVHGGPDRAEPRLIDQDELAALARLNPLAPHHQPHNLAAIKALAERDPGLKQVACFDTAFHARQDATTRRLPLPAEYEARGLMRYGFHGSSYEYISAEVEALERGVSKVLIAHLGNGGSLCAVKDGVSVATTMGFSTLDGIMMGTRCGALDPGVVLHLMHEFGMGEAELHDLFYNQSGLLGVSGISADMAQLLANDQAEAAKAIDLYCHSLIKNIGAMIALLEGVDAIVFTGGIGENAAPIRARVCERLSWLGVRLQPENNAANAQEITAPDSELPVWVIPTNEELVIARHTANLII
ncbi:MAG: acetate/propionate family kinase [Gammaproteobacteria bacterium]